MKLGSRTITTFFFLHDFHVQIILCIYVEHSLRNIAKNTERLSGEMNTGANNNGDNVSRYVIVLISKYRYSIAATSILRACI